MMGQAELNALEKAMKVRTNKTKKARQWFYAPAFEGTSLEGGRIQREEKKNER